jgi:hypothetical protein
MDDILPADDAVSNLTVSNHTGKKYVTAKLHIATRMLLALTSTGIRWCNKNGGMIGSGDTYSSTRTKPTNERAMHIRLDQT